MSRKFRLKSLKVFRRPRPVRGSFQLFVERNECSLSATLKRFLRLISVVHALGDFWYEAHGVIFYA